MNQTTTARSPTPHLQPRRGLGGGERCPSCRLCSAGPCRCPGRQSSLVREAAAPELEQALAAATAERR